MNRRKLPRYNKQGNIIELPLSARPLPPEIGFALMAAHIERKLRADQDFAEYPGRAIRELALSLAGKAEKIKKSNPEILFDSIANEVIAEEKKRMDAEADRVSDRVWERICLSIGKKEE